MTICNARIIAIEDTIGNNNALSCDEPSSMFSTEAEILVTLSSMFVLAVPMLNQIALSQSLIFQALLQFHLKHC